MDLSAIGQQFGLTPEQTEAAIQALGPVILAGMQRSAGSGGGLNEILEELQGGAQPPEQLTEQGNDILGEIFGSKDVSRGVAQQVAGQSGVSAAILKKLLPILAAFVVSQIARNMGQRGGATPRPRQQPESGGLGDVLGGDAIGAPRPRGGGLGDILGDILGGAVAGKTQRQPQGGGLGDILGSILGGAAKSGSLNGADILSSVEEALRKR